MTENDARTDATDTPVPNIGARAVSGIDQEPLTPREEERSTLAGSYRDDDDQQPAGTADEVLRDRDPESAVGGPQEGTANGSGGADGDEDVLRGEALDAALEERGLPKTGSADEKRARVAEHDEAE